MIIITGLGAAHRGAAHVRRSHRITLRVGDAFFVNLFVGAGAEVYLESLEVRVGVEAGSTL